MTTDGADGAASRRTRRVLFALAATAVASFFGLAGWVVTDHLEQDNDFCNACHLEPGVVLHDEVRRDFDGLPAQTLASAHGSAVASHRGDGRFRCIDCHGGHSLVGRGRVKVLAGKDAFWYIVGRFDEPDGMRWPLWDEDCAKCHERFDESEVESWQSPRFHQLPVHNAALGVGCVECHLSHESGGNVDAHYLHASRVRSRCAICHAEYENVEGGGAS